MTILEAAPFRPSHADRLQRELANLPGVEILDAHRARSHCGEATAELSLDAIGELRVRLPSHSSGASRLRLLEIGSEMPTNFRFANEDGNTVILADVWNKLPCGLDEIFCEFERAIAVAQRVARRETTTSNETSIPRTTIQAALRQSPWDDQTVVELPHGWELRLRRSGPSFVVSMTAEKDAVRIRRTVLSDSFGKTSSAAIFSQALRFNAQLKHARLAYASEQLVAEACIPEPCLTGATIAHAARAVGLAVERVRGSLAILQANEDIATAYQAMFG